MTRRLLIPLLMFALGGILGRFAIPASHLTSQNVVMAQTQKPVSIYRLYTGADHQTHTEQIDANFSGGAFKLLPVSGAELHISKAGSVSDWHPAPHRQYVITLSGQGEMDDADGKKIPMNPGQMNLLEDVTGKGHITRITGTEDRVSLWLSIADGTPPSASIP